MTESAVELDDQPVALDDHVADLETARHPLGNLRGTTGKAVRALDVTPVAQLEG